MREAKHAGAVTLKSDALADATHGFAGRRMNRAIAAAISGKALGDVEKRVEHAAGIEAHLAEKGLS